MIERVVGKMESIINTITGAQPRGLHNFINEIRNAKSMDEERERVDKELGNIRSKFSNSSSLTSYQRKKYVWKMCYIFMLGYEIDFGHVEFISLIGAQNYAEKSVGYMAVALMLKPGDKMMTLVVNSVRNDVTTPYLHSQCLALSLIANLGGHEFADTVAQDVAKLITQPLETGSSFLSPVDSNPKIDPDEIKRNRNAIIKKTCLCLLRLYRTNPDCLIAEEWVTHLVKLVLDQDLGVVTSAMSLLLAMTSHQPHVFETAIPYVLELMQRLLAGNALPLEYTYYRIASPWVQTKCLRFLQYFKEPEDAAWETMKSILDMLLTQQTDEQNVNKANADFCIVFEAIALVVSWGPVHDTRGSHAELRTLTHDLLGKYIAVKDANVRYLALDMLARVARVDGHADLQKYHDIVIMSLSEGDMSMRKRALAVIFAITDSANVEYVVEELISALNTADSEMREELVVKTAILAERYQENIKWYLDGMIEMIAIAGDHVAEAVWYRVVQVVTNEPDVHEYAAEKLLKAVQSKQVHEVCISLAGYLLGEIGFAICDRVGCSGFDQFAALHQHFPLISDSAKCILLTCYSKLMNLYPDLTEDIYNVYDRLKVSAVLEVQQRACEYMALSDQGSEVMATVLERMPLYEEEGKESVLETIAESKEASKDTSDKASWRVSADEKIASREHSKMNPSAPIQHVKPAAAPTYDASAHVPSAPPPVSPGPPPSKPPKRSPPKAPPVDLLSMDDNNTNTNSYGSDSYDNSATMPDKKLFENYKAACVAGTSKSTLYEDEMIVVSVQAEYRAHQGRLALTIFNKGAAGSLIDIEYDSTAGQVPGVALRTSAAPSNDCPPQAEHKLQIAVSCMRPFDTSPELTLTFRTASGIAKSVSLRLPVTTTSFSEPMTCTKDVYMSRWRALEQDKIEEQEVIKANMGGIAVDENLVAMIRTKLFPKLNIGLAEGLDTAMTGTGCLSFRTGTPGPDGQPIAVGAMLRLEADQKSGMFRVTVRAKNATVARSLMTSVKQQLS